MNWTMTAATIAALCSSAAVHAECSLASGIKHVVYLQFDNTHYLRDNPNVPSDIEQMPNLLNFLSGKGMLLANDHTQLISHTGNGLITSMTGVYPDRTGAGAISNTFFYYDKATGSPAHSNSTFVYWTDPLSGDDAADGTPHPGADTKPVLVAETGLNAPAPWVAYTRAGCDVGAIGIADIDLENTNTDLATVYGRSSPEYAEGTSSASFTRDQAIADYEGIAVHCAQGSAVCAAAAAVAKVAPDLLPDEPGGYTGYSAIFGHKYVVPALKQSAGLPSDGSLADLNGNEIGYLTVNASGTEPTSSIQPGFPGFDGMFPSVTLAYAASMLEAGVPVVYGYFSDAHDHHYATADGVNPQGASFAYGPGEVGYTNQLAQYNAAFGKFFSRLKADGIDESNTLFVILVEEGDKFVGATPVPVGCDGVTVPCTYPADSYTAPRVSKGEVDVNIDTLLTTKFNLATQFSVHTDQAPAIWLNGNPSQSSGTTRRFARDFLSLTVQDPYLADQTIPVLTGIADQQTMKLLHMVTGDPLRTPTMVGFAYDDIYAGKGAVSSYLPGCAGVAVCTSPSFAWNHGGTADVVRQTWSGMVGPGIRPVGVDEQTWADHVDTRATMFGLLGLRDDYLHDGRILVENLDTSKLPATIGGNVAAYQALAVAYKQLTAPFGTVSTAGLKLATAAIGTGTLADDSAYGAYTQFLQSYLTQRNPLLAKINVVLNAAADGRSFDAGNAATLTAQASALIQQMVSAAAGSP